MKLNKLYSADYIYIYQSSRALSDIVKPAFDSYTLLFAKVKKVKLWGVELPLDHKVLLVSRSVVKWKDSPEIISGNRCKGWILSALVSFILGTMSDTSCFITHTSPDESSPSLALSALSQVCVSRWTTDITPKRTFPSWDSCLCLSAFKE